MKKNNKVYKFAALVLLLTMVTLILVSGTYSKYTSSIEGSDNVKVAKWSVLVNNTDIASATTQELTFNLFDTINDTLDHNDEADVADNLIAPGVEGEFGIEIVNQSEVTAKYAIDYTLTNTSNIPIEFSVDNGTTWKSAANDLDVTAYDHNDGSDTTKSTELAKGNGSKTVTVKWRWAYEGASSSNFTSTQTDETDTALGIAAKEATKPEVTVNAKVVVTQVN